MITYVDDLWICFDTALLWFKVLEFSYNWWIQFWLVILIHVLLIWFDDTWLFYQRRFGGYGYFCWSSLDLFWYSTPYMVQSTGVFIQLMNPILAGDFNSCTTDLIWFYLVVLSKKILWVWLLLLITSGFVLIQHSLWFKVLEFTESNSGRWF